MVRRSLTMLSLAGLLGLPAAADAVTLTGRVVDSQGQRSYADARVSAGDQQAATDAHGFFRLEAVNAGATLLRVDLPDGESFHVRLLAPARPSLYVELDRARHVAPADDDEY